MVKIIGPSLAICLLLGFAASGWAAESAGRLPAHKPTSKLVANTQAVCPDCLPKPAKATTDKPSSKRKSASFRGARG